MTKIKPKLYETLHDLSTGVIQIDMDVLKAFLDNLAVREASSLEGDPHGTIANIVIQETLYGEKCLDVRNITN